MAKNLLICFDGTWSKGTKDGASEKACEGMTNVWRLFQRAIGPCGEVYQQGKGTSSAYNAAQIAWYDAGVGTAWYERLRGGIFGHGLDENIMQGYAVLAELYEEGDKIFLCGFSRGAYTARSLAGLIALCGLVQNTSPKANARQCPDVYEEALTLYRTIGARKASTNNDVNKEDARLSQRLATFRQQSRSVPIQCIGVWDTVKALGLPSCLMQCLPFGLGERYNEAQYGFHDHTLSPIVRHGYHALALDEHRQDFAPVLWDDVNARSPNKKVMNIQEYKKDNLSISNRSSSEITTKIFSQNIEQRWFCGSHSDIGGGYANHTLSDQSLNWMCTKLVACGLHVQSASMSEENASISDEQKTTASFTPINDSFRGFYKLTHHWRTRYMRPVHPENTTVTLAPSVLERIVFDASYRPQNEGLADLLEWT